MNIDLPAIRERAAAFEAAQNAATEGPWTLSYGRDDYVVMTEKRRADSVELVRCMGSPVADCEVGYYSTEQEQAANAEFIALARNTQLAADVRGLCAEIERYRIALADAIRRPMGVEPDSADGLLTREDLEAAEVRRVERDF